ncbi:MAG: 2-amino-4-hydroxy-6-hydroxymethyldihydropteridine diphosphokinase [Gammaproteobacteria bacterium]|nr:2-amino-4-hydroxy-6-hydroxymethyldihydropteridine diphosphokinase [Gammaproteobacteria bacterium]
MARVFVSIGSNIEPKQKVRSALMALRLAYGELQISPVYESVAVGFEGENFLNLVVAFDTNADVWQVFRHLREIEAANGRIRGGAKFAARSLDLDLLLYDDLLLDAPDLKLPRDEIHRYAFVLRPLADIAPDRIDPSCGQSYAKLWQSFDASGQDLWIVEFEALLAQ